MSDEEEQLARAFVSQLVADMEKSIDDESKPQFQAQQLRRMMKVADKKKAAVTKALIHCLDNFFTIKEMTAYMTSEFQEETERKSFQAGIQGFLKFGKRTGENDNGALKVQSYLRFSNHCEKNRMQGIVRALQKDQNK